MSFLAKLEIDSELMNVLDFHISLKQNTDSAGSVSGSVNYCVINMTIESTKSNFIFDWMVNNFQQKNGKVTFFRRDTISKMRELEFKYAYCFSYDEFFESENKNPMRIKFSISAQEVKMNGTSYTRNWPKNM
jgi:hypothetical protein